jgi:hypothetical protein
MAYFTFQGFFHSPAIPMIGLQSKTEHDIFGESTITSKYNSYGYRTDEFNDNLNKYIVISGCSLTEGYALTLDQTWHKKLEQKLNIPLVNLAKNGANAEFVSQNLTNWIDSNCNKPLAMIIQWPNPMRLLHWKDGQSVFVIPSHNYDELYKLKIINGNEYFFVNWIQSIIKLDVLCKSKGIPILHLHFEFPTKLDAVLDIVKQNNIELHVDYKVPHKSWKKDYAAPDKLHHSEQCNEQWADRIYKLLTLRRDICLV